MSNVDDSSKAILQNLLGDFLTRNLTRSDLVDGYEGLSLDTLMLRES